jgi:drug/metabolite transporter (DMT)-like permease
LLGTLSISLIEITSLIFGWIELPNIPTLLNLTPQFSYLVLIASVMGFLFWNGGMRILGAEKGVLFINLVPVTAIIIAIFQGKVISMWELSGVTLVIAALLINSFYNQKVEKQ